MKTKAIHTKDQSTVETYHEYAKRLYSLHQKNLQEFYQLGNNWDGYGSPSPNPTAITGAVNLLAELYSSGFIPHFTTPTIDNAVIIDIGISKDSTGKICGDVDALSMKDKSGFLSPVPGGVGPMTIAMAFLNTFLAFKKQKNIQ